MRTGVVNRGILASVVLVSVLVVMPVGAYGWGEDGHKIIAEIAGRELSPQAAARMRELLAGQTAADVSAWADQIRSRPEFKWTDPLHYVNLPPGSERFDFERHCPDGMCVVGAIYRFMAVLRDPAASREKQVEALRFFIHFVGDVHQPLHVSRVGDRGGNDVHVEFFYNPTNLHKVWDELLLRRAGKPWTQRVEELTARVTPDQRREWTRQLDPSKWATESHRLALSNAYAIPKDGRLGQEYYDRNLPVVEERLIMAGIRLGAMLNATFGDGQGLPPVPQVATRPVSAPATEPAMPASQPATAAYDGAR